MMIKSTIFYAIPGGTIGILIAYLITIMARSEMEKFYNSHIIMNFNWEIILMGSVLAAFLPLVAMVGPTIHYLSLSLRDSLDIHSKKAETIQVLVK